jgi:diguanylate cyclase (GGDEF)-like protein/PAS domain S-box-containing protein
VSKATGASIIQLLLRKPLWAGAALLVLLPALGALGRTQSIPALHSAWVWPPSGLALAYLWVYGRQYWPFVTAGMGVSLLNATLAHPLLYLFNAGLATIAPWVAIWGMGTLADQHRRTLAQTLWGLLAWGILVGTVVRSGINGLMLSLLAGTPPDLWSLRLPAWGASSALGVLLLTVPVVGWLLRRGQAKSYSGWQAIGFLVVVTGMESLRLWADPQLRWPAYLLVGLVVQAVYSWRYGGTWGSVLVIAVACAIGVQGPRDLPAEPMLRLAILQWTYVSSLGLLNLAVMVVQAQWGARLDLTEQALRGGGIVAWSLNLASGNYWLSANWSQVTGIQRVPASMEDWMLMVREEDREQLREVRAARLQRRDDQQTSCEFRLVGPDGQIRWLRETGEVVLRGAQHDPIKLSGMLQDVTQSREARDRLQVSEERYRMLSNVVPVGIFQASLDGRCGYVNEQYAAMLQTTPERCLGWGWADHLIAQDRESSLAEWVRIAAQGKVFRGEAKMQRSDGTEIWVVGQLQPERDADGKVIGYVGSLTDITEQKAQQGLIWEQAHMDALTGLPNRRLFMDRLEQELRQSVRQDTGLALIYIDLDKFKEVNDTLGHAVGDRLLVAAANRIQECIRASDTTARLGGDEFTVILSALASPRHVDAVAQKLVEALRAPFQLDGDTVFVSGSIGITLFPEDGRTVLDLMKHADQAMYRAKAEGRDRFCYFTPAMQDQARLNLALTQDLRVAVASGQLTLEYQPIVELATGRMVKAEALVRWKHPQRGFVSPALFIPLAEESGLIHEIGDWVFDQSARLALHLREELGELVPINVNKSPRQFMAGDTDVRWPALLQSLQLPPEALCIEITEGLLIDERPDVSRRIRDLSAAGFSFALDDFGTGYSAMGYLKRFPIQQLKIDRSFVQGIANSGADLAIVEAIVLMAHKLGLRVVAEGVETEQQRALLFAAGCDLAQGWLFGKAMAPDDLLRWHRASRERAARSHQGLALPS